jgi:hypothetical protein
MATPDLDSSKPLLSGVVRGRDVGDATDVELQERGGILHIARLVEDRTASCAWAQAPFAPARGPMCDQHPASPIRYPSRVSRLQGVKHASCPSLPIRACMINNGWSFRTAYKTNRRPINNLFADSFPRTDSSSVMNSLQGIMPRTSSFLQALLRSKTLLIPASVLCTWKLLARLNSHLATRSLNNFECDDSWDWTKEVVLITGGSNGIGAEMVRRFSNRGIKAVIWDIASLSPNLLCKYRNIFQDKFVRMNRLELATENKCISYHHVDITSEEIIVAAAQKL